MVIARELNGLDQKQAAAKLGYKNSSQLSKIETGCAPLPKSLLRKASLAYGVSADWLLGTSNSPERDPLLAGQMGVLRVVHAAILDHVQNIGAVMLRVASDQLPLESQLSSLLDYARRPAQSLKKFSQLNPAFDEDMRGSATLKHDIDELSEAVASVELFLARRDNLSKIHKPGASMPIVRQSRAPLPLFDDEQDSPSNQAPHHD